MVSFPGNPRASRHLEGTLTILDFSEARNDREAVASTGQYADHYCTSLQTDNRLGWHPS